MTVHKYAISIHKFTGLSGDTKPTPAPCGSEFFETDTQSTYICYDGVNWTVKDDSITILKAIQAAVET
jgi:hypothetical protein